MSAFILPFQSFRYVSLHSAFPELQVCQPPFCLSRASGMSASIRPFQSFRYVSLHSAFPELQNTILHSAFPELQVCQPPFCLTRAPASTQPFQSFSAQHYLAYRTEGISASTSFLRLCKKWGGGGVVLNWCAKILTF